MPPFDAAKVGADAALRRIYALNATVLLVHQMEAAFWHEWRLFGMPGGLQLYLALNLPIVLLILSGQGALARGDYAGIGIGWAVVAAGLFAVAFHAFHLALGDPAFTLPISYALLAATFVLSLMQAVLLIRTDTARAVPVR